MKKSLLRFTSLVLVLSLSLVLFGCGKPAEEEEKEPEFVWNIDLGTPDPNAPQKVIFIVVDGMRPDVLEYVPQVEVLKDYAYYTMEATTIVPPITLPAHVSMFYSQPPEVHGVVDNSYIHFEGDKLGYKTVYDVLAENGKQNAQIYSWSLLRELFDSDDNMYTYRKDSGVYIGEQVNEELTVEALNYIGEYDPDFTFLYLGNPDAQGHTYEWLSEEYIAAVQTSWERIQRIIDAFGKTHTIIIASDHGGHNKSHGKDIPEDMTVPLFIVSNQIQPGVMPDGVSIMDIMPTVVDIFGLEIPENWAGKSLLP